MHLSAFGPWPYPREITFIVSIFFFRVANYVSYCKGSVPGRMKIKGVVLFESLYDCSMSNIGGLKNLLPISECTYCCMACGSLSGLKHLTMTSFINEGHSFDMLVSFGGNNSSSSCSQSNNSFQCS